MFRAFFRRLPLAASLIVLLSVALSSGTLPAQAKSLALFGPCGGSLQFQPHCSVGVNVKAPSGAIGASTYMEVWHPQVIPTTQNDYSIAQIAVFNGSPDVYGKTYTKDIEVGWLVDPYAYGAAYVAHLFVFVRDSYKTTDSDANCLVQPASTPTGWSCGFVPATNPPALPGDPLFVTQGDVKTFYIVYTGGNWLIQYDYNWIGYIQGSWFTGGTGTFNSVAYAGWQGEVSSSSSKPTTQMGNGNCGSKTNPVPAHFYTMQVETATTAVDVGNLHYSFFATKPNLYNGKFYPTTSGTGSTLAYGGPTGCP